MELQENLETIRQRNTEVVAISTDDALKINMSIRELSVTFPLISDPQRRVIRQFGALHPTEKIARPAIFLIDTRGVVRLVFIGKDSADRPPIQAIIQALVWL